MLKVTNKNYEIEEDIQLTKMVEDKEQVIYEFKMQITEDEMQELKHILFDFAKENLKKYYKASVEERKKLESQAEEDIKKNNERFIDICFKEHKEEFRKLAGEYKFNEMLEMIRDYFMDFFTKKQMSRMNIQTTNLMKIMNNLQKFR